MHISNEFEQKFVLELNDLHQFIIRGIMLRHEMIDDWFEIKGQICIMLSQLRHMSISEAEVYIDLVTGYFSPGRKLSVCPDDCLTPLYSRSHHICALLNTLNWKMSGNYILGYIKSKYDEIKKMIETYRSVLGENEGNKRIAEIFNKEISVKLSENYDMYLADVADILDLTKWPPFTSPSSSPKFI